MQKRDLVLVIIIKSIIKSEIILNTQENIEELLSIHNLRYKTLKEIPTIFHNGYTYDYHFLIKELAKELEGQFECLG